MTLKRRLKRVGWIACLNALVKARRQEARAAFWQRHYEQRARALGLQPLTEEQTFEMLGRRLALRGAKPKGKRTGELHIFLAYPLANWEVVLPVELARFGRVTEFEWLSRGHDETPPGWTARRDRMNEEMLACFREAHSREPVDAVVGYLSGWNTSPETLHAMAAAGTVVFNFCWDDKLHYPGQRVGGRWTSPAALASSVDLNLTNAPSSIVKYRAEGGLAIFWPEAASPDLHRPFDVPFEFDVTFVGQRYGWRPRLIGSLIRRGVRVEAFGSGWPNGLLENREMVRIYSRSRINLGFGGVGYSRRLLCLKGRDFEVPLSGGLYLTQHNPELSAVYDVGREILTYHGAEDCTSQIERILRNQDEARSIRERGRGRALRDHTWQVRFQRIFRSSGLLLD